jgi:tRNA 2-selenouridine synthase
MSDENKVIHIDDFLLKHDFTLVDVRSNSEYNHAHIPGAVNVPLLTDSHRKIVGTTYKVQGKELAVQKGFELAGPFFYLMIQKIKKLSRGKQVVIYCWRGGMRSEIMQWILTMSGIDVLRIDGGYKAFRNKVLQIIDLPYKLAVVGGKTGSGKTAILVELQKSGQQVIDLEGIANHKGSAFGSLGQPAQPTNEMFENILGMQLFDFDISTNIWVENESRSIGANVIPKPFYERMRNAQVFEVAPTYEYRFNRIKTEYGCFSNELLQSCTEKIKKRLGPNNLKIAIEFLSNNNFDGWLEVVLNYYDKQYEYSDSLRKKESVVKIVTENYSENRIAQLIIEKLNELKLKNV